MKSFLIAILFMFSGLVFAQSNQSVIQQRIEGTATTSSASELDANLKRKYLLIVNKCSETMYVGVGASTSGTEGIPIPQGGNYEPFVVPVDEIFLKAASTTCDFIIVEGE